MQISLPTLRSCPLAIQLKINILIANYFYTLWRSAAKRKQVKQVKPCLRFFVLPLLIFRFPFPFPGHLIWSCANNYATCWLTGSTSCFDFSWQPSVCCLQCLSLALHPLLTLPLSLSFPVSLCFLHAFSICSAIKLFPFVEHQNAVSRFHCCCPLCCGKWWPACCMWQAAGVAACSWRMIIFGWEILLDSPFNWGVSLLLQAFLSSWNFA